MKNKMKSLSLAFGIWLAAAGAAGAAEPMKSKDPKAGASQEAMMAEMMKMAAPGENHKVLDTFAGQWNHTIKARMTPEAKMEESKGTTTAKWVMGGRFIQSEARGMWAGQPFEGLGYMGYDNMKGEYNAVWLDNMNTGIMKSASQYDPAAKTFAESGTFSCPMTGEKEKWFRSVTKIQDRDRYTQEMYFKDADGKEFKSMEIAYVRATAEPKK